MKTKLEIDTEMIANYCGVSAKNSHYKISSYHLTLRKPFVEALGIEAGDTVDVAILQVNKGLPKNGPALPENRPAEEPRTLDKPNEGEAANLQKAISPAPDSTSTPRRRRSKVKKEKGKRGSRQRGRRGK